MDAYGAKPRLVQRFLDKHPPRQLIERWFRRNAYLIVASQPCPSQASHHQLFGELRVVVCWNVWGEVGLQSGVDLTNAVYFRAHLYCCLCICSGLSHEKISDRGHCQRDASGVRSLRDWLKVGGVAVQRLVQSGRCGRPLLTLRKGWKTWNGTWILLVSMKKMWKICDKMSE